MLQVYYEDRVQIAVQMYAMCRRLRDPRFKAIIAALKALCRHPAEPNRPFFSLAIRRRKRSKKTAPTQVFLLDNITETQWLNGRQLLREVMAERGIRRPRQMDWSELKKLTDIALLAACCDDFFGEQWKALRTVNISLFQEFDHQQWDITLSFLGKTRICANSLKAQKPGAKTVECHSPFEANARFWVLRAGRSLSYKKSFRKMKWTAELEDALGG